MTASLRARLRGGSRFLAAGLVCAAGTLAGCGGSNSSSSTATASLSVAAGANFANLANQICANADSQIEALPAANGDVNTATTDVQQALPIENAAIAQLRNLTPPAAQQQAFTTWISGLDRKAALTAQEVTALQAGNGSEAQVFQQQVQAINTNSQATSLGLPDCAKNAQPAGAASGATGATGVTGAQGSGGFGSSSSGGASPSATNTGGGASSQGGGGSSSQGGGGSSQQNGGASPSNTNTGGGSSSQGGGGSQQGGGGSQQSGGASPGQGQGSG